MSQHVATLLLGSNLGDRKNNIEHAINLLELRVGKILKKSPIARTKPVEFASCNIFCNIALSINTRFSPLQLLIKIKEIEEEMGRLCDSSVTGRYEDRLIDIDIVKFGNLNFFAEKLQIPHVKHLHEREFSRDLLLHIDEHYKNT